MQHGSVFWRHTVTGIPARTLRLSDILILTVPRAWSAKTLSVGAPSVWNSLSCNCRSAMYFSTFRRILKTELFDQAYNTRKQSVLSHTTMRL